MLGRRNANGEIGHDDHVLIEDDGFGGEETPMMRKGEHERGGWAAAGQTLYFDEEREREGEREFLESLRYGFSTSVLLFSPCVR